MIKNTTATTIASLVFLLATTLAAPCLGWDKDAAVAKYKEGMEAIKKDDYPKALEAFETSYGLNPQPGMLFNIAMCHKALFRYVDAIQTFERYLEQAGPKASTGMKQDALDAIAELSKMVGTLTIRNAPDGAMVIVRGEPVGKTPFEKPLRLDPGQYPVRIIKAGYAPMETKITIAAEAKSSINAVLESQPMTPDEPETPPPAVTQTAPEDTIAGDDTKRPSGLFWVGVSGTIVSGALAGVFFGLQSGAANDYAKSNQAYAALDPTASDYDAEAATALAAERDASRKDALKYNKAAIATTVTAGALALGSVIVLVAGSKEKDPSENKVSVRLSPTGLALTGKF